MKVNNFLVASVLAIRILVPMQDSNIHITTKGHDSVSRSKQLRDDFDDIAECIATTLAHQIRQNSFDPNSIEFELLLHWSHPLFMELKSSLLDQRVRPSVHRRVVLSMAIFGSAEERLILNQYKDDERSIAPRLTLGGFIRSTLEQHPIQTSSIGEFANMDLIELNHPSFSGRLSLSPFRACHRMPASENAEIGDGIDLVTSTDPSRRLDGAMFLLEYGLVPVPEIIAHAWKNGSDSDRKKILMMFPHSIAYGERQWMIGITNDVVDFLVSGQLKASEWYGANALLSESRDRKLIALATASLLAEDEKSDRAGWAPIYCKRFLTNTLDVHLDKPIVMALVGSEKRDIKSVGLAVIAHCDVEWAKSTFEAECIEAFILESAIDDTGLGRVLDRLALPEDRANAGALLEMLIAALEYLCSESAHDLSVPNRTRIALQRLTGESGPNYLDSGNHQGQWIADCQTSVLRWRQWMELEYPRKTK